MPGAIKPDEITRLTHYHVISCCVWINGDCPCCRTILESELEPCLWFVVKRFDAYDFLCNCKRRLGGRHGVSIHMCNRMTSSIRGKCQQNSDDVLLRLLPNRDRTQTVALRRERPSLLPFISSRSQIVCRTSY